MGVCFVKWGGFANGKDIALVIVDRDLSNWSSKLHKKYRIFIGFGPMNKQYFGGCSQTLLLREPHAKF